MERDRKEYEIQYFLSLKTSNITYYIFNFIFCIKLLHTVNFFIYFTYTVIYECNLYYSSYVYQTFNILIVSRFV